MKNNGEKNTLSISQEKFYQLLSNESLEQERKYNFLKKNQDEDTYFQEYTSQSVLEEYAWETNKDIEKLFDKYLNDELPSSVRIECKKVLLQNSGNFAQECKCSEDKVGIPEYIYSF